MTSMEIDDGVYSEWVDFYNKHDKVEFPTLKNFTARKLRILMEEENNEGKKD